MKLKIMMGLRDSSAEMRRKADDSEDIKNYIKMQKFTSDSMALPAKYESVIAKNEI